MASGGSVRELQCAFFFSRITIFLHSFNNYCQQPLSHLFLSNYLNYFTLLVIVLFFVFRYKRRTLSQGERASSSVDLCRSSYKSGVLPNKSASYLDHRRARSRGMNMGQKISGTYILKKIDTLQMLLTEYLSFISVLTSTRRKPQCYLLMTVVPIYLLYHSYSNLTLG